MPFTAFDILTIRETNGYRALEDVEHWLPVATGTLHNYARTLFLDKPGSQALEICVVGAELSGFGLRFSVSRAGQQAHSQKGLADINACATFATPEEVAWFLASYAREAKFRVEEGHLPALTTIRTALEEALGMKFDTKRGEHFFRSTLIQTLFYGMFSAWVLWSKSHPPADKKAIRLAARGLPFAGSYYSQALP